MSALQHGDTPQAMSGSLGTVPAIVDGEEREVPASPLGVILGVLIDIAEGLG